MKDEIMKLIIIFIMLLASLLPVNPQEVSPELRRAIENGTRAMIRTYSRPEYQIPYRNFLGYGNVCMKKGNYKRAIYYYDKALKINPIGVDARINMGFCKEQLSKGNKRNSRK